MVGIWDEIQANKKQHEFCGISAWWSRLSGRSLLRVLDFKGVELRFSSILIQTSRDIKKSRHSADNLIYASPGGPKFNGIGGCS